MENPAQTVLEENLKRIRGCNLRCQLPVVSYPRPATRGQLPEASYPRPATRGQLPEVPATRCQLLPTTRVRVSIYILTPAYLRCQLPVVSYPRPATRGQLPEASYPRCQLPVASYCQLPVASYPLPSPRSQPPNESCRAILPRARRSKG